MGSGRGSIQRPQSRNYQDHISGRWRVNIFFMLLVSVHSVLLPWTPAILTRAGLALPATGLVMAAILIATLISVKVTLIFVTATRNGSLRRFTLFILLVTSLVLYIIAVSVLPPTDTSRICSSITNPFSGLDNNSTTTISPSLPTSTITTLATSNHTSSSVQVTTEPLNVGETDITNTTIATSIISVTSEYSSSIKTAPISTVIPTNSLTNSSNETLTAMETTPIANINVTEETATLFTTPLPSPLINYTNTPSNQSMATFTSGSILSTAKVPSEYASHHSSKQQHSKNRDKPNNYQSDFYNSDDEYFFDYKQPSYNDENSLNDDVYQPLSDQGQAYSVFNDVNAGRRLSKNKYNQFHKSKHQNVLGNTNYQMQYRNRNYPIKETNLERSYSEEQNNFHEAQDPKIGFTDGNNYSANPSKYRQRKKSGSLRHKRKTYIVPISSQKIPFNDIDMDLENIKNIKTMLIKEETENFQETEGVTEYMWLWVSMLLVSATILGGGIETSVTRLWHCYSHGYHLFHGRTQHDGDDLLERALTDTFELSACGEHYGWTRISAGGYVIASSVLLTFGCQIGVPPGWSLSGQAGVFSITSALTVLSLLLILPIPWGSIKPPKLSRPLSLYLDDEVLWEGLRRVACPAGAALHGVLFALPAVYVVPILEGMAVRTTNGAGIPVVGVASLLIGEGVALCCRRRLAAMLDCPALVGTALAAIGGQMAFTWALRTTGGLVLWVVALSWVAVGTSKALLVMTVRQNALMLATIRDQEREAWVSWSCGRCGEALGALVWASVASGPLQDLLLPAAVMAATMAATVAIIAVLTRNRRSARRRVYHTLDLHAGLDEEDSEEEEDWLVKGARKEGLEL